MAFRLNPAKAMGADLVRVVREQTERAAGEAADRRRNREDRIHQARSRCKRIRAAFKLARALDRPRVRDENRWFRDAARALAPLRDAAVMRDTLQELQEEEAAGEAEAWAHARQQLPAIQEQGGHEEAERCLAEFAEKVRVAETRLEYWTLDGEGFETVAEDFVGIYRRARRAARRAFVGGSDLDFHFWRKLVKIHGYHLRLLREAWPKVLKRTVRQIDRLSDLLGRDHDLAVLQERLAGEAAPAQPDAAIALVVEKIQARQTALRAEAIVRGRRLFAEKPAAVARKFARWWQVARETAAPV